MSSQIHPTAIIEEGAELGVDVSIGPYCVIGANVKLGDGCTLHSHVVVKGHTEIGPNNEIFPFASIGHRSQDKKYNGEPTTLVIGADNTIREYATLQPGTVQDLGTTVVGDRNLLMVGTHVAHDCIVGNDCVLANHATLAGHVNVADQVIIGGLCAVHQKVQIGRLAIIGGASAVDRDILPFATAVGNRAKINGLNLVGLRRQDFDREVIKALKAAFEKILTKSGERLEERAEAALKAHNIPEVAELVAFTKQSTRGISAGKLENGS